LQFESSRLIKKRNSFILKPIVAGSPGLLLSPCQVRAHHGCGAQKAKQAELGEAAEKEAGQGCEMVEPPAGGAVVDMAVLGEGDPDVDIREKK
jgi:hypothetical protein